MSYDVGGGQAHVDEPRGRSDHFRDGPDEGHHVVARDGFDLVDPLDGKPRLFADFRHGGRRDAPRIAQHTWQTAISISSHFRNLFSSDQIRAISGRL